MIICKSYIWWLITTFILCYFISLDYIFANLSRLLLVSYYYAELIFRHVFYQSLYTLCSFKIHFEFYRLKVRAMVSKLWLLTWWMWLKLCQDLQHVSDNGFKITEIILVVLLVKGRGLKVSYSLNLTFCEVE